MAGEVGRGGGEGERALQMNGTDTGAFLNCYVVVYLTPYLYISPIVYACRISRTHQVIEGMFLDY